jgi:protocatechuate 3,4-dioxygenase beta subunit
MRHLRLSFLASAIVLCAFLSRPFAPRPVAAEDTAPHEEIIGTVLDSAGKPVQGATVRIWAAGARVGVNPYCPTCYRDCSKTAESDSAGAFTIKSLDPTLVFKVLFVKKRYEPKFASIDPLNHKPMEVRLEARPSLPSNPRQILSGQVVDSGGKPVVAALVEPFGGKDGEERWWGGAKWTGIDPLAVTDEAGRFEIMSGHPADTFDLEVTARALAKKKFLLVPTAKADNRLVLTEGATVRGRVVDHGRPVASVRVGMIQADRRGSETFLGPLEIGTDAHGEFLFANVPPDRDCYIYGIMDSLRDRGRISDRRIHVGADGSETKLGDLAVEPAYRITGRLVLSDGKPLPPHTRINIGRENAWDSQIIEVDPSGAFTAPGIPPELVTLHARADGYRMSNKNRSFEPLNAAYLTGLVQKDIDGLLVLLEPGSNQRFDPNSRSSGFWKKLQSAELRIKSEPLMGVVAVADGYQTAGGPIFERPLHPRRPLPQIELPPPLPKPVSADANVPKRAIVGRVVDQAGKTVAGADVWYRVCWNAAPAEFTVHAKTGADGRFKLEFPIEWSSKDATGLDASPWVVAYAPGYAVGFGDAVSLAAPDATGPKDDHSTQLEIQVGPPVDDDEFTVLTPDGAPLAGARVGLPHGKLPELDAKICGTTDKQGRARFSAFGPEGLVEVQAAGYGSQLFFLRAGRASNSTLQLAPVGRIEGQVVAAQPELFRGMSVSITTRQKTTAVERQKNLTNSLEASGQAELHVGADGRFVVPEIVAGEIVLRAQIADERLPVRPRVIENDQVEVVPSDTTWIEIPLEMLVKVHGLIRVKETGKPVAGAEIVVGSNDSPLSDKVRSDANGRYSATALPGDVGMRVIDVPTKGVRQSNDLRREAHCRIPDDVAEFELPVVEVEKCKDVAGLLLDKDGKPAPTSSVEAFAGEREYFAMAREQGKFEFRDVPKGTVFDRFRVGSTGPNPRFVPFTIQSQDPLLLRLK